MEAECLHYVADKFIALLMIIDTCFRRYIESSLHIR